MCCSIPWTYGLPRYYFEILDSSFLSMAPAGTWWPETRRDAHANWVIEYWASSIIGFEYWSIEYWASSIGVLGFGYWNACVRMSEYWHRVFEHFDFIQFWVRDFDPSPLTVRVLRVASSLLVDDENHEPASLSRSLSLSLSLSAWGPSATLYILFCI